MKAPTGKLAFAYRTIAALEAERDALAQRCRELEAENSEFRKLPTCWSEVFEQTTELERAEFECDTLRAEVAQLRSLPARLQQIVTTQHESTAALAARVRNTLEDYQ